MPITEGKAAPAFTLNDQDGKPVAQEMRRMGFSQSLREGDEFRHSVILLSGQPKADVRSVCAHEYTHLWQLAHQAHQDRSE